MSNLIIGMAGHIDHGKTTLVQALTGVNTDSLPEEKNRGMTIDIGFTKLDLPDGTSVGLIDVPGHEKFIKNMTAGISSINFVILVIACDDGIMPQTIEHFEIIKLLGIKNGIIVLTKKDLVNNDKYLEVFQQCQNYFKDTFLADSIYSVSIQDKNSYEYLKLIIQNKLQNINCQNNFDFKMNIDRVFSINGFGTVVTGTIINGHVQIGDVLTLYPQNKQVKVKNIQNHGVNVNSLSFGYRCALNLANINKDEIARGNILAKTNSINTSNTADVRIYLLDTIKKLKQNSRIRINIGTDELIGRICFADRNFLKGNEVAYGKIIFEEQISGNHGDIGIVRNYSPVSTIGSIKIINIPSNNFKKNDKNYITMLDSLNTNELETIVENKIKYFSPISEIDIDNYIRTSSALQLQTLKLKNLIYQFDKRYIHREQLNSILTDIQEYLHDYHQKNHLEPGVERSTLKTSLFSKYTSKEFNLIIDFAKNKALIKIENDYISLLNFKIKLSKDEKLMKEVIFSIYKSQKFNLHSYEEILHAQSDKDFFSLIHNYMVNAKFIIHTQNNFFILKGYLQESIKIINTYFTCNNILTVSKTRELLNCDRDSAILILQMLDELKITKLVDGVRTLHYLNKATIKI